MEFKVLDVDTGEKKEIVPLNSVRNLTAEVFNLPVFNIPVRFSIDPELEEIFTPRKTPKADDVLSKCLHMMLWGIERGLRLKFHWWDTKSTYYIPGVWVVTGFLVDVFTGEALNPRVSVSDYILRKYLRGDFTNMVMPGWPVEDEEGGYDEYWGENMRPRPPCLQVMIDYYFGLGQQIRDQEKNDFYYRNRKPKPTINPDVDPNERDTPIGRIFMDHEYLGLRRAPPQPNSRGKGLAKFRHVRVALETN